ncbi:MAG: SSI family serine proteinase inhibitor [Sporichthyaceae bacterium]
MRRVVGILVVAAVAAATPHGATAATDHTHLTVAHRATPNAPATRIDLSCAPGADHSGWAEQACAVLTEQAEAGADPFAPVAPGRVCAVAYGGPATAQVTGRWYGRAVSADFKRTNGCEVARWDRLSPVLDPAAPD